MKPAWKNFLETAAVGVVGRGRHGIASRCLECRWSGRAEEACGGFGEGCVLKAHAEPAPDEPKKRQAP